jgi:hypothetical protein
MYDNELNLLADMMSTSNTNIIGDKDSSREQPTDVQVCSAADLHAEITEQEKKLQAPWLGTLPFKIDSYGDGNYIHHDNILELMKNSALSGHCLRFCPAKYPPNQQEGAESLVRDIFLSARDHGVELVCGGGHRPPVCKSLVCSCSLLVKDKNYKENAPNKENDSYRLESLHNDRKNNRQNGHQSMPRRRTTKRRLTLGVPFGSIYIKMRDPILSRLVVDVHFTRTMLQETEIQYASHRATCIAMPPK